MSEELVTTIESHETDSVLVTSDATIAVDSDVPHGNNSRSSQKFLSTLLFPVTIEYIDFKGIVLVTFYYTSYITRVHSVNDYDDDDDDDYDSCTLSDRINPIKRDQQRDKSIHRQVARRCGLLAVYL